MHFNKIWVSLCELLITATTLSGLSTAVAVSPQPSEIKFLTGSALSDAVTKVKAAPARNLPFPYRRSDEVHKRAVECSNNYWCSVQEVEDQLQSNPQALSAAADIMANYLGIEGVIEAAQAQNVDLPGDVGQSFYLGFAANDYAWLDALINTGSFQAYLALPYGDLVLNSIFSLEDLTNILTYCGDTTFDALASRIASLTDAFLTQFTEGETNPSTTVIAANVDENTGDVAGISVGGTYDITEGEARFTGTFCPAFGYLW